MASLCVHSCPGRFALLLLLTSCVLIGLPSAVLLYNKQSCWDIALLIIQVKKMLHLITEANDQ